jgi:hypothetical protein
MDQTSEKKSKGRDLAGRLLEKVLMPIVATAASAAATYAAKKAPQIIDAKVAPKVRELVSGAGSAAHDLPAKAKAAAGDAGDVAERLTDRARSAAGGGIRSATSDASRHRAVSTRQLEQRLGERRKARAERRKTTRR